MDKFFDMFNDHDEQIKFGEDMRKYELYVIIPYIVPILFFIPYAVDKESDFCRFHSNQSLCWLIIAAILVTFSGVIGGLGPVFSLMGAMINVVTLLITVFLVMGAWRGYAVKIPLLGDLIKPFG